MIIIFTYNRKRELQKTLNELEGVDEIIVFDDGSQYDPKPFEKRCTYLRYKHGGKYNFYKQWQRAFSYCKESNHDRFIFLPDDMENFNWDRIQWVYDMIDGTFACNVCNVGWNLSWTNVYKKPSHIDGLFEVGWMDHGTITNRQTLEALDWAMIPPPDDHFITNDSSGVGKQISVRLHRKGIPMYMPYKSFAEFQQVESQMHVRKQYPVAL